MKKNVLLLCGYYYSDFNANTVCAKNIACELEKQGYNAYILTYYDKEQKQIDKCYDVKLDWLKRHVESLRNSKGVLNRIRFLFWSSLRRILIFPFYPFAPSTVSRKYTKRALEIINKQKIDMVIGFYKPYDPIASCMKIKKKLGNKIISVTYHLDLANEPEDRDSLIGKYKKSKALRAFKKEKTSSDLIIAPLSESGKYPEDNIRYVDFPLFISETGVESGFNFDKNAINLVYVGSLDDRNRNPEYFFNVIQKVNEKSSKKVILHIWGKMASDFDNYSNEIIQFHGIISNECVIDLLKNSDYVVNISNYITYQWIPSKIFQLFASGKPIINVVNNSKDVAVEYFRRYGCVCYIEEFKHNFDKDVEDLFRFLLESHDLETSTDIERKFESSTPKYFVRQIEELLYE